MLFAIITSKLYQSQKRWGVLSKGLVVAERRLYLRMALFIFFTIGTVFQDITYFYYIFIFNFSINLCFKFFYKINLTLFTV